MTPKPGAAAPQRGHHFLWWLALCTAGLAGLVAGMLALQIRQSQDLENSWQIKGDSVTALAFQFEREFLRLRHAVEVASHAPTPEHLEHLGLRYNIFLSRKTLLEDNPSTQIIKDRHEYQVLLPQLEKFVVMAGPVLGATLPLQKQLEGLFQELQAMGPSVQALSFSATSVTASLIENNQHTIREQSQTIQHLTLLQLVLLLLAAVALWIRHQRMDKERLALEILAQELREAHQKAEAASEGKSRFLANMSHELRTPFNGMLGMLSMLESTALTGQQHDWLRTARESAQHLLALLNDILDISSMESGKLKLKPEVLNLKDLLSETDALMQVGANSKGLSFVVSMAPETPEWVIADKTRLRQILFNLISNGIKFTDKGHVTLNVAVDEPDRNDARLARLKITVTDTGIGMDEQMMGRLFERFYQVESGTNRRFGGAGLGLEISRTLARMMDGDLTVTSALGKGSVFTLLLPLPMGKAPADSGQPPTPSPSLESVSTHSAPPKHLTPVATRRILVAEDHPVNRKVMAALLGKLNVQVTFCENGQQAVEAVSAEPFDLVFMDIHMPVMDGLAATRSIRQSGKDHQSLPIIALTADVMNDAHEKAMQAGVNEFLTKPIRLPELQQAIARWAPVQD